MPETNPNLSKSACRRGRKQKGCSMLSHMIRGRRQEARSRAQGRKQQEAGKEAGGGEGRGSS